MSRKFPYSPFPTWAQPSQLSTALIRLVHLFHWWTYICNREEQIWLHIGSVSFTLTFVFYRFCCKLITKEILPMSLNYTSWPIPGNTASHAMRIKLKYLCLAHRKPPDKAHLWMTPGRKKLTHPLWSLTGTRKCLTLPPTPFSIKEAWVLTQGRWFFGTQVHHLLGLLAFLINLSCLAPATCLSIYWLAGQQAVWAWTW